MPRSWLLLRARACRWVAAGMAERLKLIEALTASWTKGLWPILREEDAARAAQAKAKKAAAAAAGGGKSKARRRARGKRRARRRRR